MTTKIALIGYGEVGRILAEDLSGKGHTLWAFDVKLHAPSRVELLAHAEQYGVTLVESHADAVRQADLVISAVTASQTLAAARTCAIAVPDGCFFLDLNSASPGAKRSAAADLSVNGGRYVEGAVMTSLPPHRLRVPLLIGGPDAEALQPLLDELGFAPKVASHELGVASATKMCRSVMIKGLEALMIESLTAARHYGVEAEVIASLYETFPSIDWEKQAAYFFQRVLEHGRRRSEEMRDVAVTVQEAGLEPWGATAIAEWQAWVADAADAGWFGQQSGAGFARSPDWRTEADRMLTKIGGAKRR